MVKVNYPSYNCCCASNRFNYHLDTSTEIFVGHNIFQSDLHSIWIPVILTNVQ